MCLYNFIALFLRCRNVYAGRVYSGRTYVRPCVRLVAKCTIKYCERTAGPRSANFLYAHARGQGTFASQFSSKSSTILTFNLKVKIQIEYILSSNMIISQAMIDRTNIAIAYSESRTLWTYLHLTLANFRGHRKGHIHSDC